ncbi:hypothetical protein L2E82_11533 [Cichorium intybus]|uniref:Uncharacterized protein n=1 Tax=Cichorium intybus TaxID=13427 RepID=A0ACB9GEK3_CICIN|nr:hypothetical protein L2E82_11533 [Cichorium intybus]
MDEEDEVHYRPPSLQSWCFAAVAPPPEAMRVDVQLRKREGKIEPSPPPLFDRKVHCSISTQSIVRPEGTVPLPHTRGLSLFRLKTRGSHRPMNGANLKDEITGLTLKEPTSQTLNNSRKMSEIV